MTSIDVLFVMRTNLQAINLVSKTGDTDIGQWNNVSIATSNMWGNE